ncbi:hypothetical protein [Hymenobacter coccineus]|uniref:Nucleotide-diphospho-sugar transferase domain-containing protein n=1 Tax=Hymenobacter coccineus TaxID=1908235 RepID=A0A1G1TMR3_9BACT|nr:hypothetical protein [Hymenobacter coccineus]OGX92168.1 hypothetical protein BEN49_17090 [Hymenobacter coccineus]
MADFLLYQAYGNPDVLNEALFSILSYLRQPVGARVVVYTDNPAHFQRILGEAAAVEYVPIAPAQWQAWRGEIDFVHRVKIEVLLHAAARYAGNLLYVDTDTVFVQPLAEVFGALGRGERFMHVGEGRLRDGNSLNRKINQALQQDAGRTDLAGGPIPPDTQMYNAGALGLRTTDAPLLAQVLTLTEQLHRLYPKHVMEQLAFSVVLARAGVVRAAAPWVYHYWNLKEIRPVLAELFTPDGAHPLAAWQVRAAALDVPALAEGKAQFRQNPGWRRAVLRWLKRDWRMPAVAFPAL